MNVSFQRGLWVSSLVSSRFQGSTDLRVFHLEEVGTSAGHSLALPLPHSHLSICMPLISMTCKWKSWVVFFFHYSFIYLFVFRASYQEGREREQSTVPCVGSHPECLLQEAGIGLGEDQSPPSRKHNPCLPHRRPEPGYLSHHFNSS